MMMGKKTALLAAAMYDHVEVVRLLVDRGAELLPPHYVSVIFPPKQPLIYAKIIICAIERVFAALGS